MLKSPLHLLMSLFVFCLLLAGCSSGPQKAVDAAAEALKNKDSKAFEAVVDLPSCVEIALTEQKEAYRQAMGNIFGSSLADQAMRFADNLLPQSQVAEAVAGFKRSVETGQISMLCMESKEPDCPWIYESLKNAKVKETGSNSAVASVDTPNGLRQWLAIRQYDDGWKIMAISSSEGDATFKCSDERFKIIQEALEKRRQKQVEGYKNYEKALAKYKTEKEEEDRNVRAEREKAQQILSNIVISDMKCTVRKETPKYQFGEKYLYALSALVENRNAGKVSDYEIKVTMKEDDVITNTFTFSPGYSAALDANQKYSKSWNIWANSIDDATANKINEGAFTITASVETARFDGQAVNQDGVGLLAPRRLVYEPRKPAGYDDWKQKQN